MALFKRKKYLAPPIGSALDPYHYPEDSSGKPAATPSPRKAPDPGRGVARSQGPEPVDDSAGAGDPTEADED